MRRKQEPVSLGQRGECFVCALWGVHMVRLGPDKVRHVDCAPGSRLWCEWYKAHPEAHTEAGDILFRHATQGRDKTGTV